MTDKKMTQLIIGICGKKQSGKDTLGQMFETGYGFKRIAFADKIKQLALELFGIFVPVTHGSLPNHQRKLVRDIGEKMREIDDNVWTDYVFRLINKDYKNENVVLTDVRRKNELGLVKNMGGIMIRLKRNADPGDNHRTETELDDEPDSSFDYILDNANVSFEESIVMMKNLIERILKENKNV